MALFSVCKVFDFCRMPSNIKSEVSNGSVEQIVSHGSSSSVIRVFLTGYDDLPLTREWLLRNGAEKSDRFVYVLFFGRLRGKNGTKG